MTDPAQIIFVTYKAVWCINGDQHLHYHGMATISFIDGKITGTITIDGGSGRFKNAMGEVSMNGYASLIDNTAGWTGDGWISY